MFFRNLHEIYFEEYFLVRHVGFSGEYVNTLSPAERGIFKSYYAYEKEQGRNEDNTDALNAVGLTEEDML